MAPLASPSGLLPFDPIEDLDIVPTRDHIVLQQVKIQHGSLVLADVTGNLKKKDGDPTSGDYFGYVLAVGPGRMLDGGVRRAMSVQVGDFVRADGRLMFHYTPSHKKVHIGLEDVVVGIFKPASSVLS